jgi:hypothetical protein
MTVLLWAKFLLLAALVGTVIAIGRAVFEAGD